MKTLLRSVRFALMGMLCIPGSMSLAQDDGFVDLFNGKDLTGFVVPEGDGGAWKVVDGVIDYNADSQAKKDKNLWTEKEYKNFVLEVDWRIKSTPSKYPVPIVLPDGSDLKGPDGKSITLLRENADSGIYVRGTSKAQLNIWCWPVGSGEVYGYRKDMKQSPEVRAGVTPKFRADNPVGEWNRFTIFVIGDRLTVLLNQHQVIENAQLPGLPESGRIAFQHHGGKNADGTFRPASSLVQFKRIRIREL